MNKSLLPSRPNVELYKKLAKDIVKAWKSPSIVRWQENDIALNRYHIASRHPRMDKLSPEEVDQTKFTLADAQFIIARQYDFESWPKFIEAIDEKRASTNPYKSFVAEACVRTDGTSHQSGTLAEALEILAENPELATKDIFTASILGDVDMVAALLSENPKLAKRKGGPYKWDALTYLCFSRFLKLDAARSDGFVRTARVLLENGASVEAGWHDVTHGGDQPEFESVMYGAAGYAQHAGVTQVLLDFGADPNDNETPYHSPETGENSALKVILDSGKFTPDSLSTVLVRKADWHDYDGMKLALQHGADPNRMTIWDNSGFHHSIRRDNDIAQIELQLSFGADPALKNRKEGRSAVEMAARRGRKDIILAFTNHGFSVEMTGVAGLILACAVDDRAAIAKAQPEEVKQLIAQGGSLLAEFAGNGNVAGVKNLLDLGVPVDTRYGGDGYFGITPMSTALHVAAWKNRPNVVKLLIDRGASVSAIDMGGRTPLMFAVQACTNSFWTYRRSPDAVRFLLEAGAKPTGIRLPSGYEEIDKLLLS